MTIEVQRTMDNRFEIYLNGTRHFIVDSVEQVLEIIGNELPNYLPDEQEVIPF